MLPFYSTIISTYIFSLLSRISYKKTKIFGILFLILVILVLILVSGLRNGIGDTVFYMHSYRRLAENPNLFKFDGDFNYSKVLLSNYNDSSKMIEKLKLRPYEAVMYRFN